MKIVDFHTHILPGIDDGSRDRDMTVQMLKVTAEQGIDTVIATSHFYPDKMSFDHFIQERNRAMEQIADTAAACGVQVLAGAEVAFFTGISRAEGLKPLCVEGTRLLLLEMPFRSWHKGDLQELDGILQRGYRVMLAHPERFAPFQTDRGIFSAVLDMPVLVQVNAESLVHFSTRRTALKLMRREGAVLGSDCHNLTARPQNLLAGRRVLEKRRGAEYLRQMDLLAEKLL